MGAYIFCHFGDRYGRRNVLVWTLVLMGVEPLAIAILRGNAKIGLAAPVILFVVRIIQGIGIGGEFGGAVSWVAETASKSKWRTFLTSVIVSTGILGIAVGLFSYTILFDIMGKAATLSYGWRYLFGVGALIMVISGVLRFRFTESPLFKQLASKQEIVRFPASAVLKKEWKKIFTLALSQQYNFVTGLLVTTYASPFLIAIGISSAGATFYVGLGVFIAFISGPIGGLVGSKIGMKKTMTIGPIISAVSSFPLFLLMSTKIPALIILGVGFAMWNWFSFSIVGNYFSSQFNTKFRYSGSGLTYQFVAFFSSIILLVIIAPIIAIYPTIPKAWPAEAVVGTVFGIFSLILVLLVVKKKEVSDLAELDKPAE